MNDQKPISILKDCVDKNGYEKTVRDFALKTGYTEVPPTINEFIEDDYYLGKYLKNFLYPGWKDVLNKIYPNSLYSPYNEVAATGAIGIGKTTFCSVGIAYDLMRLLYLKDPHLKYGLMPITPLFICFFNETKSNAEQVLYRQFKELLYSSPFFREQMEFANKGKLDERKIILPHNISIMHASQPNHALGRAIISAILSELNFQGKSRKNQAYENYQQVSRRMDSRFMRGEGLALPGKLWLDSSKTDELGFLENHLKEMEKNPKHKFVTSSPIWEIVQDKGKVKYSGERFWVFVGDQTKDPCIVRSDEQLKDYEDCQHMLRHVPIEYKDAFESDIYGSLRDIAGVSTWSAHKFIMEEIRVDEAFTLENPCKQKEIALDFYDSIDQLILHVDISKLSRKDPYFLHIDIGTKIDRTGIALTRCMGEKPIKHSDRETNYAEKITQELCYQTDLVVAVVPKPGKEVPIAKLKKFAVDLQAAGIQIGGVSADSHQSEQMLQDLAILGFKTEMISTYRYRDPYEVTKNAILQGRLKAPNHEIVIKEFKDLVDDGIHIDHPENAGNSKINRYSNDMADAVAGSLYNCMQRNQHTTKALTALNAYSESMEKAEANSTLRDQLWDLGMKNRRRF